MEKKIIRTAFFAIVLIACVATALARTAPQGGKVGPVRQSAGIVANDATKVMDISNVWTGITNYAMYGDPNSGDTGRPSGQWPGGSDNNYIWEGRFWAGALVQGKKYVSHADYSAGYEFHSAEDDPFFLGPAVSIQDALVFYDDLATQAGHFPLGLRVLQRGLSWSMPEFSNFVALQMEIINTGSVGTLPNFYVAWVFDNDIATADPTEANIDDDVDYDGWDGGDSNSDEMDLVDPLDLDDDGLDGYDEWGIPYGWANSDNPGYDPSKIEPDGVWDEYQIFQDDDGPVILRQSDGQPLVNAATGDTLQGWLLSRNLSILYDGDNATVPGNDTGERGLSVPCDGWTGGRLIYTPRVPYNTAPDDTMPRPFAHMWWNWNSDPGSDDEMYEYMSGTHAAGMGYNFIPNPKEIGAPTFDYRWLTSSGPFTFAANDTLRFIYVYCCGQGLKGVRESSDKAMIAYYAGSTSTPAAPTSFTQDLHWVLPVPPPIPNLNYSGMDAGVRLAWDNHAEFEIDPLLGYSDFEGYKVYRAAYAPANWQLIYACDNLADSFVYVTSTEGDTMNPIDPLSGNFVPVDLPSLTHAFDDLGGLALHDAQVDTPLFDPQDLQWNAYSQPVNNVPYFYTVVGFDSYKPANPSQGLPEMKPQESARSNYLKDPQSGAPIPVYPHVFIGPQENPGDSTTRGIDNVKVVPNPYRGTDLFEARYESIIRFINLPPACKITILTITGDIVQTIDHSDGTDSESWDLLSKNTQSVVSGLYLYIVETQSDKKIGKFVIAR
jgi:hypothetical protein